MATVGQRRSETARGGRPAYLNRDGAFLGDGAPLLERDVFGCWRPRPDADLAKALQVGDAMVDLGSRQGALRALARAMNDGDLGLAGIALVQARLPLSPEAVDGEVAALAKYSPSQPRLPSGAPGGGEWTSGGGADVAKPHGQARSGIKRPPKISRDSNTPMLEPASFAQDPTALKKQRFIEKYLAATIPVARDLNLPVENILGLGALEGSWGEGRFVKQGNNLFSLYYPAPFADGSQPAQDNSKALLSTYKNYSDCLKSFSKKYADGLKGVSDPVAFATVLQQRYKFGIIPKGENAGKPDPKYIPSVVATIRGLHLLLAHGVI